MPRKRHEAESEAHSLANEYITELEERKLEKLYTSWQEEKHRANECGCNSCRNRQDQAYDGWLTEHTRQSVATPDTDEAFVMRYALMRLDQERGKNE